MSSFFQIDGGWNRLNLSRRRCFFCVAILFFSSINVVPAVAGLETPSSDQTRTSLSSSLEFTAAERAFIKTRDVFTVSIINNFPPFCYTDDSQVPLPRYKGFTVDLVHLLAEKTGLALNVQFNTWSRNYADFKAGQLDVVAGISHTPERESFVLFTDPYYIIPNVVYTRGDFGSYTAIKDLFGKKVAIEKDIYYKDLLKIHEKIQLVEIEDTDALMKALSFNQVDAVVTNMNIGNFFVNKLMLDNIRLAGEINLKGKQYEDLRFGIPTSMPLLHSIFQKGLNRIREDELLALQNKWVGVVPSKRSRSILLSEAEKKYLAEVKKRFGHIKIGIQSFWEPMASLDAAGNPRGIVVDLVRSAAENAGLPVLFVPYSSLAESLDDLALGEINAVSALPINSVFQKQVSCTDVFVTLPLVIATRSDKLFIRDVGELDNKTIGLVRGFELKQRIRKHHPLIRIKSFTRIEEGLSAVEQGLVSGFVDTLPAIGTSIKKSSFVDLKVAGKMDLDLSLGMAVPEQDPVLSSLLNKALSTLTPEDKKAALDSWKSIRVEEGFDYALFWKLALAMGLVVLGVLYWNRRLNRFNTALTREIHLREKAQKQLKHSLDQVSRISDSLCSRIWRRWYQRHHLRLRH